MILNDYTQEYASLKGYLDECIDYIEACKNIVQSYENNTFLYTDRYFSSSSSSRHSDLGNDLSKQAVETYKLIKILNSKVLPFSMAIGKMNLLTIENDILKNDLTKYINIAYSSIRFVSSIILDDLDGVRKGPLLKNLFSSVETLVSLHTSLTLVIDHLTYIENGLLEPIPTDIPAEDFSVLELRSSKQNINFSEVANDLSLLSSFLKNLEYILSKKSDYTALFIRKIETGSLRIVWGGTIIELSCISDIIQAVTNAIRTFRITGAEKKIKEEEAKANQLKNEEKALSIINTQIDTICKRLELDPSSPKDREDIQRMCLPLVKYINSNPVGCIGDFQYDLSSEIKLLEDTFFSDKE